MCVSVRWKGSGCKFCGGKGKRYKLFWMGDEERSDSVGYSQQRNGWTLDSVVSVERHSKRVLILKVDLDTHSQSFYCSSGICLGPPG